MTDHILPHNHGEHLNTELLIDNIAKTEDFQIVADLFNVLEITAGYAFSGFSATAKNV